MWGNTVRLLGTKRVMLGSAAGACVAALVVALMSVTSPAQAYTWAPPQGPVFNNPHGNVSDRYRVVNKINNSIKYAPRGSTIRFATYNLDRMDSSKLLIAAHRRGVHIQVVLNDNFYPRAVKNLVAEVGKNRHRPSFVHICSGSCRSGDKGNLHIKIYSFSKVGPRSNVMISSSANLATAGASSQWNDADTIYANSSLWKLWVREFNELKADRRTSPRFISYNSGSTSVGYQRPMTGRATTDTYGRGTGDRALDRLKKIGCSAPAGYGSRGRTVLRIAMYAWYDARGERLARQVAALKRHGCNVKATVAVTSKQVIGILKGAHVPVRVADWDWGQKQSTSGNSIVYGSRCYSHYKWMSVNGRFNNKGTFSVWTGSENWSPPSFSNDEVTWQFNSKSYYKQYGNRFNTMWSSNNATHSTKVVHPTRRPCAG